MSIPKGERWTATGKRKTAVARAILVPGGSGKIYIRKWRTFPKKDDLTIPYTDPKTGEKLNVQAMFSDKQPERKWAVPSTKKFGKRPFRYTPIEEYFGRASLRMIAQQPFEITQLKEFDVYINVSGGGHSGQAGAIRHAVARAMLRYELSANPELTQPNEEGIIASGK
ncbi:MAG: 30S ribosomal protein S9, partial [Myxococcota bacterium]